MRFSDLPALTDATLAAADIFPLTDASDTNDKKITAANLAKWVIKNTSYQVGDVVTIGSGDSLTAGYPGWLSGSKKCIIYTVYLPKPIASGVTGATVNVTRLFGRYVSGNTFDLSDFTSFTVNVYNDIGAVRVMAFIDTAQSAETNNTPLTVQPSMTITFT